MLSMNDFSHQDGKREKICASLRREEAGAIDDILPDATLDPASNILIWKRAKKLVQGIRGSHIGKSGVDALLNEFDLSSNEGVVLMCLAEALLRVPDNLTADKLILDKIGSGDWSSHLGRSDSLFVNASALALLFTHKIINLDTQRHNSHEEINSGLLKNTIARLGEPVIRTSIRYAMQKLGKQFVLGKAIDSAISRARAQEVKGYLYSYDMLGEGARTMKDADHYFDSYRRAIAAISEVATKKNPESNPGISVKLSALHPRYEVAQRDRVLAELVPRVKELAADAMAGNIGFTIDAEEADRQDLSLDVIEAVITDSQFLTWEGFGLAVQAYLKNSPDVIDWVTELAVDRRKQIMVRLVKGAYWDSEIKRTQVAGLHEYPVFTYKKSTDVCYQACARKLLAARPYVYPQFATHNAYAVASILEMDHAGSEYYRQGYEFQRLHGMGQALFDQLIRAEPIHCRIYAPVGEYADLLAYLVRRLLENGANTSFVNNIIDEDYPIDEIISDPVEGISKLHHKSNTSIPLPSELFSSSSYEYGTRINSAGIDINNRVALAQLQTQFNEAWDRIQETIQQTTQKTANRKRTTEQAEQLRILDPADQEETIGYVNPSNPEDIENKLKLASDSYNDWSAMSVNERACLIRKLSDLLETETASLLTLCVKEAGKTIPDSIAELREAVDFLRYYANQAERLMEDSKYRSRGVILCISPWNFPLAIFLGQVSAALVTGNTVLAKPAEQTSLIALKVEELMKKCRFPPGVFQLVIGKGMPIGEQMIPDERIKGVMFTGSTQVGRWLNQRIGERLDNNIPLIAETGGQNAMIVDSTALPEQVVNDVITSGFQSAGQRCSALRVLFLQEEIAAKIIELITGAMMELTIGDPAMLSTDIGPVIDKSALRRLEAHRKKMAALDVRLHFACELPTDCPNGLFFPPHLYGIETLSQLEGEVFGPVVHVIRYKASNLEEVIGQINHSGFGLTLGAHSRIQSVSRRIANQARVGNIYINRNMIGAVVGSQPFGGTGLSGTGPKAGGPHYLDRLVQTTPNRNTTVAKLKLPEIEGDDAPVGNLMDKAMAAYHRLRPVPLEERITIGRELLIELVTDRNIAGEIQIDPNRINDLFQTARRSVSTPRILPGPTGESNLLYLESRGILAILADDDLQSGIELLIAGLLSGNSVILMAEDSHQQTFGSIVDFLTTSGCEDGAIHLLPNRFARSVFLHPNLGSVLISNNCVYERDLRLFLSKREGPIIPVIQEEQGHRLLESLMVEKTVSADTTAAGGNASLMAMGTMADYPPVKLRNNNANCA